MTRFILILLALAGSVWSQAVAPVRPPAIPLVAHDPYFSIWSTADRITDSATRHWTGAAQPLIGLIRIDNVTWRYLGDVPRWTEGLQAMRQVSFDLTPTRTAYGLEASGVRLDLTFLTPALPADLDVLSRPVTYLAWSVRSVDGKPHQVKLYLDCSSYLALNRPEQRVMWSRHRAGGLELLRVGSQDQKILNASGDDLRIDWGYFYLAVPAAGKSQTALTSARTRAGYTASLVLPDVDALDQTMQVSRDDALGAVTMDLGSIGAQPVSRHVLLAYDDLFSIEYFQRRLRPYWRRNGWTAAELLLAAERDYEQLQLRCRRFDEELTRDLVQAGGAKYAALAVVAYRQTLAAHKLAADLDGRPLYFSKENFSNGCIDTVDVTYPSSPFFLLLNPELLKAQLRPVLDYARLPRWPWRYAPHDLGQYPLANGQVYGGAEVSEDRQMPVEESGNMLIMLAALAEAEGDAGFSREYWPLLTKWAEYLREKGMDPENQLSTDDFAGHLAHNTNLSLKAIVALAGFARLAGKLGHGDQAAEYERVARAMAARWAPMAEDGDHYRLAFDKPGTWSQKYNLVWDKLLGLKMFPAEIARKEVAYYLKQQNAFGLPLDNRSQYTKLDWIVWTATLADNARDFAAIADFGYRFANETSDRVPLSDWFWTDSGKHRHFQARSVVGGVFIKMLEDRAMWQKWARH